jgi:acetolactate synthase I/II/III large subunit
MSKSGQSSSNKNNATIGRRGFLKGAGATGAALGASVAAPAKAQAQAQPSAAQPPNIARETLPPAPDGQQQTSSGGDFMVDVLKTIGFDYCTQTPASTFRGLQRTFPSSTTTKQNNRRTPCGRFFLLLS